MKKIAILLSIVFFMMMFSCKKNQLNGKSVIQGSVKHHSKVIPNAKVYIKFKAKEFPGRDFSVYDAMVTADSLGVYSIKCYKGDYYLFGTGYDSQISENVFGGTPVHIRNNETVDIDIAVTED